MNPHDFIFNQIKTQCIAQGCIEKIALAAAESGLKEYKQGKYSRKPIDLIEAKVREANRLNKNASK